MLKARLKPHGGIHPDSHKELTSQEPIRQLWLAARSGGYHFDYDEAEGRWICDSSDEQLGEMLVRITLEQSGAELEFDEL